MTPPHSSWGNRFVILDDRGRGQLNKIAARILTCVLQYTCREAIFKGMKQFGKDWKTTLVITWKEYHPLGINRFMYVDREERYEISSWYPTFKAIKGFKTFRIHSLDKIVAIRHEHEFVTTCRNHHNLQSEIVL